MSVEEIRGALRSLKLRAARGEVPLAEYERLFHDLVEDLSPAERAELGLSATPAPATPQPATPPFGATPQPAPPASFGPSGGKGKGVATRIASLSDLDLKPGTILFDQWRIERELGRGGFGVVVEAEELTLGERQAVKVLDPPMVARPELLERFRREVKATRKLVHPRIVRVFDYRENLPEGLALFSMEYVRGCSVQLLLAAARDEGESVPVPLALTILEQVLEALEAAHAQGVIHRDVTPANILLAGGSMKELLSAPARGAAGPPARDPQVKLVDFGIAGALERSELSQKSRVLGTAAYVAPEVLDPRVEVTTAADVYGAGAVFYELLTGKPPLGRFADPSRLRPGLSPRVEALSLALLESEPAARPSAKNARESTREAMRGESGDQEEEARKQARAAEVAAAREAEERAARQRQAQLAEEQRQREAERAAREAAARAAAEARARDEAEQARRVSPPVPSLPQIPVAVRDESAAPQPRKATWLLFAIGAVALLAVAVLGWLATRLSARPAQIRWVTIPAGNFTMGCTSSDSTCVGDETPPHRVTLTKSFQMAAKETTNAQYRACVEASVCSAPLPRTEFDDDSKREHPVIGVSWDDAVKFCQWAGGSLPTEAEWEYAARGGKYGNRYPWGNALTHEEANYGKDECCGGAAGGRDQWMKTSPVGSFAPNGFGLFDTAGNVWEWCADWYDGAYYGKSPSQNPAGPSSGSARVLRGGSWFYNPLSLRVSARDRGDPLSRSVNSGFRCVRGASSR